jgi:hypothetical protein
VAARVLPEPVWDGTGRDPTTIVAWVLVALTVALVIWESHPELIFQRTTPHRGDLGAHLHEVGFLRDHLLPHFKISGWSPDHYAGYAIGTYYFAPGGLLVALGALVLPYLVAFKAVAALGPVLLPIAAYAFGRLTHRSPLTSACFAVFTLPFLLEPVLFFGGGSIAASANGEYNYTLALAVGLVALGMVWSGLASGRRRVAAALLLAATVLVHALVGLFVFIAAAVLAVVHPSWARLRWLATTAAAAVLLTGFWTVPFVLRAGMTSGYKFPKDTELQRFLLPEWFAPVLLLAAVGLGIAVVSLALRIDRLGVALGVIAAVFAVAFITLPINRFGNQRVLALWFLPLCLLAGSAIAAMGRWIDDARQQRSRGRPIVNPNIGAIALPCLALLLVPVLWPTPAGNGALNAHDSLGRLTEEDTRLSAFVEKQYGGYERSSLEGDYHRLIAAFRRVGKTNGCGRVQWEWTNSGGEQEIFMMMIPYWTDGCLGSIYGLFAEASATSPYPLVTNGRLAPDDTYHWKGELPLPDYDLDRGITQLRLLGVRYYMATSARARADADANPALRRVAAVPSSKYPWSIYELVPAPRLVEPLASLPVRSTALEASWRDNALRWFGRAEPASPVLAASGPSTWPRQTTATPPPRAALPAARVSAVRVENDRVSFRVDRTGVPVLVRVSYFPNWKAHGARGPYRVTPNYMVVVPTSNDVSLRYGITGVEILGWLVSLLGLGVVVLLLVLERRSRTDAAAP